MFNISIWSILAHLRDIRLQNLSDLDFNLSRPFKVKCCGATGLPYLVSYYSLKLIYGLPQLLYEI